MKSSTTFQEHHVSDGDSIEETKHGPVHLYMFLHETDIPLLTLAIITTIFSSLGSTGLSLLTGRVFDLLAQVSEGKVHSFAEFDQHAQFRCFSIAALAGGVFFAGWATITLWMRLGERQQLRVRDIMYSSLFSKSMEWFESNSQLNGDIVQMNRCIEEFRSGVSECSAIVLQCCLSSVALSVTSLIYSWKLTLVILSSCPLIVTIAWIFNSQVKKFTASENAYSSSSAKLLDFTLSNPMFVKIFNGQSLEMEKFKTETFKSQTSFNLICLYSSLNVSVLRILVLMMFVQGFWYGFHLVKVGELTSGKVITTFLSCLLLAETFHGIAEQLIYLQKAKVAINKIMSFIGMNSITEELGEQEARLYPQICHGDIKFDNVNFSYPSRNNQKILDDVSFRVTAGKVTYIVGESGSGKSTLSALLLKFYQPSSGTIRIDGFNIEDLSPIWLTDTITLVEQSATLFNDSLKNNIALGVAYRQDIENVSQSKLDEAVQFSLLQNLVFDLPEGINTPLGIKGNSLSGGEQQRVSLARAKLRDTPILILDEATSGLDAMHKELMIVAIKKWRKGKTTIIMTHELNQIEDDDNVIMMEKGKFIASNLKGQLMMMKDEKFQKLNNATRFHKNSQGDSSYEQESDYFEFKILNDVKKLDMSKLRYSVFTGRALYNTNYEATLNRRRKPNRKVKRRTEAQEILKKAEEERPEKLIGLFATFKFMNKHIQAKVSIVFGLIFAVINGVANPLFSYSFSKLLKTLITATDAGSGRYVMKWALIVVGTIIADGATTFLKKILLGYASESWIIQIRHTIFKQILDHDLNWSDSVLNGTNEISALLMNDTRDLRTLISEFLDVLFTVSIMLTMGVTWSLVVGWKLSLVGISMFPAFIVVTALYSGLLQSQENSYKTSVAKLESHQHQTITGIKTIKCLRLNSYFNKMYISLRKGLVTTGSKRSIGTGFGVGCSALLLLICQSIILYYGTHLVAIQEYTYLQMMETLTLLIFTISSATDFMNRIPDISRAQRLSTYLKRLLSMEDNYEAKGYLTPCSNIARCDIVFDHVSFNYPSRPIKILNDISFEVERGQVFGIVGESGSGKSTIISLILKLQSCEGLYIWGTPIKEIDTEYLRSSISVVSQRAVFFEGSIRENLLYGIEDFKTDDEIFEVLKLALIYDFVVSLPQGLETHIGNDANSLISGGQAQRLSIARSLLRKPKILILDECTSALDPLTSSEIRRMINKELRVMYITIIVITHHEAMMRIADSLIVLKDGRVAELGSFDELCSNRESELSKLLDFSK